MLETVREDDQRLLEKVSGIESPLVDGAMSSVSSLGSVYLAGLFVLLTHVLGAELLALEAAAGLLATWSVGYGVKHVVKRPRPSESFRSAVTYSFPSGHTATACFLATFFSFTLNSIAVVLHALALTVGLSRVYLRLHYPSDAAAGGFIGFAIGMAFVVI